MFRAMVGGHASFTLSDSSLQALGEMVRDTGAGLHIHAAEDLCDVEDARSNHAAGVVERLDKFEALNERTILAHGIHLDDRDIRLARDRGVWFAHNPRSNMNNRVGYAPVAKFGERVVLGTDGIGADMFEEARFAFFKASDGRAWGPAHG
jgi:cytosine/adenosine deaminase-related metal-dependent hydrolase